MYLCRVVKLIEVGEVGEVVYTKKTVVERNMWFGGGGNSIVDGMCFRGKVGLNLCLK